MANLTVRQLIAQLRKMPQDAIVIWKDHDHAEGEYNNFVRSVDDVTDEPQFKEDIGDQVVALSPN